MSSAAVVIGALRVNAEIRKQNSICWITLYLAGVYMSYISEITGRYFSHCIKWEWLFSLHNLFIICQWYWLVWGHQKHSSL